MKSANSRASLKWLECSCFNTHVNSIEVITLQALFSQANLNKFVENQILKWKRKFFFFVIWYELFKYLITKGSNVPIIGMNINAVIFVPTLFPRTINVLRFFYRIRRPIFFLLTLFKNSLLQFHSLKWSTGQHSKHRRKTFWELLCNRKSKFQRKGKQTYKQKLPCV